MGISTPTSIGKLTESSTTMNFRNEGDIEFMTQYDKGTLSLVPKSTKNLDKVDSIIQTLDEKDFISLVVERLYKKTKLKWQRDTSYRGAGYGFKLDSKELLKQL